MTGSPRPRALAIALVLALAIALFAWHRATRSASSAASATAGSTSTSTAGTRGDDRDDGSATASTSAAGSATDVHAVTGPAGDSLRRPLTFDARVQHTVDPCTVLLEPAIPDGFDTVTASGITVAAPPFDPQTASPTDGPLRPLALAHAIAGMLEEAAALTGTPRRDQLTVIVYPTRDEYFAQTHAPAWSAGLYDGRAVRIPAKLSSDLGVAASTLRHEIMHAQLHAAVGCMPAWFNEGIAMYFGDPPPVHEWLAMLRERDVFDLDTLQRPVIDEKLARDAATRAYARSLAMVMYLVEHGGEASLGKAVQTVLDSHTDAPRLAVWNRLYPRVDSRAVLDTLATKIFGTTDLDDVLGAAICCYGLRAPAELACRAATTRSTESTWVDRTATPAACRNEW
ncbi:MAG TPA: hypothetical protein VFQ53_29635 [Kofleriaceae bacterium]|nr:hypothetical protein [Kofleriaceae bacterium]